MIKKNHQKFVMLTKWAKIESPRLIVGNTATVKTRH